jgi:hypothetical protein
VPPPLGAGFVPKPPWARVIFVPLVCFPVVVFFLPDLDPVEVVCFLCFVFVCLVQTGDSWSRTVLNGGCW